MTRSEELFKNRTARKQAAQNLYEEALRGAQALEKGNAAAYLETLTSREKVMARMDTLEAKYKALSKDASEGEPDTALAALEGETRAILENVLREDEAASVKGKALLEEYREKLKALRENGRQVKGYTNLYKQMDSIYIDKKR